MSAWGLMRSFARKSPWWLSATLGVGILLVLALPTALTAGSGDGRYYGWYTTADGRLLTGRILDQVQYTRLTDATAGRAPSSEVAPFTSRALAPWLAGRLPVDASIALTLVSLSSLALGTFALALLARDLTRRREAVVVAVAVWAVSFPVLKYSADAFVDPVAVGLIPCVLLAMWRRWLLAALVLFAAAIWMKETSLALLPVAVVFEWMRPDVTKTRRGLVIGTWIAVAAAAFLTASTPGGRSLIVFAPWVPASRVTVERMLLFNLLTPPRLIAYGLTVLPAVLAVSMWWRGRSTGRPVLAEPDARPLVVGCAAGALLGLISLPTALLDGRTVWTTLPMAALLLAGWTATHDSGAAWVDVRRFARAAAVPLAAMTIVWVLFVLVAPQPTGPEVLPAGYRPRFTAVPTQPEDLSVTEFEGSGSRTLTIPGEGPVLVEFDSDAPISMNAKGGDLIREGRARTGVALLDTEGARTLEVSARGPWRVLARPVSSALFWETISPLNGHGPNVLVFPGGLPRPMEVVWSSDDPGDRIELVGGCRLGTCGQLDRDGVVPAGTEALAIDAAGDWELVPGYPPEDDDGPVLDGTEVVGRQEPS